MARRTYDYIIWIVIALVMAGCSARIVPKERIRSITGPEELKLTALPQLASELKEAKLADSDSDADSGETIYLATSTGLIRKPKSLSPLTALEGKKAADTQAHKWDEQPSLIYVGGGHLILVIEKNKSLDESKKSVATWIYVYKNQAADAWLGVLVGSIGVIDVGQKRMNGTKLLSWLPIGNWSFELDQTMKSQKGRPELFGIRYSSASFAVWTVPPSTVIDARTGERVSYLDAELVYEQVKTRELLW